MPRIILAGSEGGIGMPVAVEAMQRGLPALDIVETSIRPVETDPSIRSVGVGGWPNLLGQVELDASIMEGKGLRSGAVGALQGYLHPISVARQVMERLPHVFLVGEGAAHFAAECEAEYGMLFTEESRREWQSWMDANLPEAVRSHLSDVPLAEWARLTADPIKAHGTTITLVSDLNGDIAAGVSTCGWAFKYPGRLGDSPIVGAGCYADNRYGAAACMGQGELAIRGGSARAIVLYMKMGMSVQEACEEALNDLRRLQRAYEGGVTLHAIDARGEAYVVTIGDREPAPYWIWIEGMAAAEKAGAAKRALVKGQALPIRQMWDPERYARNARFVADMGMPVVDLLAPRPGERILDLGCGDGALTTRLVELGCRVTGIDASPEQIAAAQARGLDARVLDAQSLPFEGEFDAVFSNAALHWIPRPDDVIEGVWRAVVPGGRFVGECGGQGNIVHIRTALYAALRSHNIDPVPLDPWYFPGVDEYRERLERRGFRVDEMALFARPTPLPGDIAAWLETFAGSFLASVPDGERPALLSELTEALRPHLCDDDGQWTADYVRLRFAATKPASIGGVAPA